MRLGIAVAAGPVLVVLVLAIFRLGWWSMAEILLLTLVAVIASPPVAPTRSRRPYWIWSGAFVLMLVPGVVLMIGETRADTRTVVSESDVVALVERDLAYWLANQAGPDGAVVLAPPNLTTSLYFHGGLSGLGTPYWENKDGFLVAVRIAGATSLEEAQAFAQRRHLTYIVLPSWDPFMDEYARLGSGRVEHSLVDLLHQWLPPRWLRPMPYHVPKIPGFEGWSAAIFQVTDVQDNPAALSRLAEYFVEMEQLDQAALVRQALERLFPTDLGALVARALVAHACGDNAGFTDAISTLPTRLARSEDGALPWDRRVSLVIALTEDRRFELAREQTKRCLAELDEVRLRSLTTVSLYRLQVISKAFGLGIDDGRLHALALSLLPAEMRGNL
jgi:tetratricopeptide (TPR) repeat protein